ncbi:MAG: glycoside hydrolase family 99-like domain-containing protein [Kiritimatiellia bacterium]
MPDHYDIAAYIWPGGIGEWETVRTEEKRCPDHHWPRKPLWGYVNEADPSIPYFPHVAIGRDNNPRFQTLRPRILKNNTPANFEKALVEAGKYADTHPDQPPLITINSWNEWTEGSYLQPDDLYGYGYLDAVKRLNHSRAHGSRPDH